MELRKMNRKNLWKIVQLRVTEQQTQFVATNTESILEAYANISEGNIALPFGLYEEDVLVGFIMFGYGTIGDDEEPELTPHNYCIWRLMIDTQFQGKGYGRKAMETALAYLKTYPCGEAEYVWLSYEKENVKAKLLYHSMGFHDTGEICEGEVIAARKL